MGADQVVALAKQVLMAALWMAAPILLVATVVSLLINIAQVLTSLQETTLATVPRLAAVAAAALLFMPWMVRHMGQFAVALFSDFHPYLR
ncbi:MAG TPA: flagellar biosynthetic protein FliQ [Terriglobales bacterium]|jgi:flagellar biosynthetic protein FliQ